MERIGIALIAGGVATLSYALLQLRRERESQPRTPCGNPFPLTLHAVLPAAQTCGRRIIIVGDIHGCPEELQRLLDKLGFEKGRDVLLSVGDLVNKGPDSRLVLRMAHRYGMQAVRGNHDDAALAAFTAWLDGKDVPKPHKHHWVPQLEAASAELLRQMPFTLTLPAYGVLLCHAGLVPGVALVQQQPFNMIKMRDVLPVEGAEGDARGRGSASARSFDWEAAAQRLAQLAAASSSNNSPSERRSDATVEGSASAGEEAAGMGLVGCEQPVKGSRAWAAVWRGPPHVVFGHDAKRRLQLHPCATGLDTGCVYGGQLTALVLPALDEQGVPLEGAEAKVLPDLAGSQEIRLSSGHPAWLVSVDAADVYSTKFIQQQLKAQYESGTISPAAGGGVELRTMGAAPTLAGDSREGKKDV